VQRDLAEGMEDMARRCAEEFVRANGYTADPATDDSTRWVLEVGERGPWPGVFAMREGTLAHEATTVQCSARRCVVLFRPPRRARCLGAVTPARYYRLLLEPVGIHNMRSATARPIGRPPPTE
jgi:hypothetical protein